MEKIKIVNKSQNDLPSYASSGASGMDLRADLDQDVIIKPMEIKLIPTGIYVQIPEGYEIQIRARSGLALKHGITMANGIGTIDSDYRGEIGIILINLGGDDFKIQNGDRIAQMVVMRYQEVQIEEVEEIDTTLRGDKGFGSSGID